MLRAAPFGWVEPTNALLLSRGSGVLQCSEQHSLVIPMGYQVHTVCNFVNYVKAGSNLYDRVCCWMQSDDRIFLVARSIMQNEDSTSTYPVGDYQDSIW